MIQSHGLFEFGQIELNERLEMLSLDRDTCHQWKSHLSVDDSHALQENIYPALLQHFDKSENISDVLGHFAIHQVMDQYLKLLFSGVLDQRYIDEISRHAIKMAHHGMSLSLYSTVAFEFKRLMIEKYSESVSDAKAIDTLTRRLQLDIMLFLDRLHHKALEDVKRYTSLMEVKDTLTDLYLFTTFMEELDRIIAQCQRHDSSVLVIRINIKNLKAINDRHGYHMGNQVLQTFASSTQNLIRKSDVIARGEDDNFYLALTDTDHREAKLLCDRIVNQFESECELPVTLCFGGAAYSSSRRVSPEQLLVLVDEHLKYAQDRSKITDNHESSIYSENNNSVIRLIK
jgi:diguanylate cyclase (GGDEF)-like protein